jgi:hypothetical protein
LCAAACAPPVFAAPSLFDTVAPILTQQAAISRIWPGYWTAEDAFLIYEPEGNALLYTPATPPPAYLRYDTPPGSEIPAALRERLYWHQGVPPGLSGLYDSGYEVGATAVMAVNQHGTVAETLTTLFHEAFHIYQSTHFSGNFEDSSFVDPDIITPALAATAEVERRLLREALRESEAERLRGLAQQYLALRSLREQTMPADAISLEYERERSEGTALLVGLQVAALVLDRPEHEVVRRIGDDYLGRPLKTFGGSIQDSMFRWRLYGTGAAIGLLLDRSPAGDWRERLERGEPFRSLLADAVDFASVPTPATIAQQAMDRYGYQDILENGHELWGSTAVPSLEEFYDAPARVIVELPGSMTVALSGSLTFSGNLFQLDENLVLVEAALYTAEFSGFSLAARELDVLTDMRNVPRITIALAARPEIAGIPVSASETRIEQLTVDSGGLTIRLDRPATISSSADSVLLRITGDDR